MPRSAQARAGNPRPIPLDDAAIERDATRILEAMEAHFDKVAEDRAMGRQGSPNWPYGATPWNMPVVTVPLETELRVGKKHVTGIRFLARMVESPSSKIVVGGNASAMSRGKPAPRVVGDFNGARLSPAALAVEMSNPYGPAREQLLTLLRHELTHLADHQIHLDPSYDAKGETPGDDWAYYNDPLEVRAFLREAVDEAKRYVNTTVALYGTAEDEGRMARRALRASETWRRVGPYLRPENERKFLQAITQAVREEMEPARARQAELAARHKKPRALPPAHAPQDTAARARRDNPTSPACEEDSKRLADYLNQELPYPSDLPQDVLEDWVRDEGLRQELVDFEPPTEEELANFQTWAKRTNLVGTIMGRWTPDEQPPYLFFEDARPITEPIWCVHFTRGGSFYRFDRGATIDRLHLSTHFAEPVRKPSSQNIRTLDDHDPYATVYGFAFRASDLRFQNALAQAARKYGGTHAVLFQVDCGVVVFHATDNEWQVIFPLGAERQLTPMRSQDGGRSWTIEDARGDEHVVSDIEEALAIARENEPPEPAPKRPRVKRTSKKAPPALPAGTPRSQNPHAPGQRWYHGTSLEAAKKILARGVLTAPPKGVVSHKQGWFKPQEGYAYLTRDRGLALQYARMRGAGPRGSFEDGAVLEVVPEEPCVPDEDEVGSALEVALNDGMKMLPAEQRAAMKQLGEEIVAAVPKKLRDRWKAERERDRNAWQPQDGWSEAKTAKEGKAALAALPPEVLEKVAVWSRSVACKRARVVGGIVVPARDLADFYSGQSRVLQLTLEEQARMGLASRQLSSAQQAAVQERVHDRYFAEQQPLGVPEKRTATSSRRTSSSRARETPLRMRE